MLKEMLGLVDFVGVSCDTCSKKLEIPMESYFAIVLARNVSDRAMLRREHGDFCVSPDPGLVGTVGFYCDRKCYTFFTED